MDKTSSAMTTSKSAAKNRLLSIKTGFIFLILLSIISFLIIEAFIIINSHGNDTDKVDYVVVLGAGLYGETPSPTLHYRLNTALEYIRQYPDVKVVVSGGQGPDELITEAEAMKRFLLKHGVREEQIIKEDKSTNTMENLAFTRKVINDPKEKLKILIVTSEFHMFRSKMLARRSGFIPYGKCAPSPAYHKSLKLYYFLREYFAVIKSLIFDR